MQLAVFYHVYQHGDWRALVTEQVELLRDYGLWEVADVHIGVAGTEELNGCDGATVFYNEDSTSEGDTLRALASYAQKNDAANILYMHTKGLTHPGHAPVRDWRLLMEHFCVERWEECVELLDRFDAIGVNLNQEPEPHFSGNFWWARAQHIRGLNDQYLDNRRTQEFWIGSSGKHLHELYHSNVNHYYFTYPRALYDSELSRRHSVG